MTFHKLTTVTLFMLVIVSSLEAMSQTCKIKTSTGSAGVEVFTEVFEYDYVDEKPEFPGGGNSLVSFINSTRHYPEEAYQTGIQGRVTCAFIVNPDGKISNIQVLRGVEPSLNKEAMRVIAEMPHWSPGKINDTPVPVRVVCCIPFRH